MNDTLLRLKNLERRDWWLWWTATSIMAGLLAVIIILTLAAALGLPDARMLAEARAYRLSVVMAHQNLAQLPPDLRQGISDDGLRNLVIEAIARKPLKHEFNEKPSHVLRFMSMTGG